MAQPSSGSSSPVSPGETGLGNSVNFSLPIDADIEERMASISYLTSFFKVEEVVVKAEKDDLLDLGSRVGGAVDVSGAVDLADPLVGQTSPRPGSGAVADLDLAISPVVQNSPKQGLGSPGTVWVGMEGWDQGGAREAEMEGRVVSPVPMEEDNADPRDGDVSLKKTDHYQSMSPPLVSGGEFSIDLLERWAREDFSRANERGRLISSWYTRVESTREENDYLCERVDRLSEELQVRSSMCETAEKSLEDSRLTEAALRKVIERRDSRIDELTRELEDVKSQLARAQRIAMEPTRVLPVDVASLSDVLASEGETLFGVE